MFNIQTTKLLSMLLPIFTLLVLAACGPISSSSHNSPKCKAIKKTEKPENRAELLTLVNAALTVNRTTADLNHIDTSKVTDMSRLFESPGPDVPGVIKTGFNGAIDCWDTSEVRSMDWMFVYVTAFNGDIGGWDTGSVMNMSTMFKGARTFNQDIGDWDVRNVINMHGMFESATAFNQDISKWQTVTVDSMSQMFKGATAFNQDLSGWNVAKVKNSQWFTNSSGMKNEYLPKFK